MSYPKKITRFASQFGAVVDVLEKHPDKPFYVTCATPKDAFLLRQQFHAYRALLRKEPLHAEGGPIDCMQVTIEDNVVWFQNRDYTAMALAMNKALEEVGYDPVFGTFKDEQQ